MSYDRAIGLIETRGLVPLTAGIEAMMKTANVECIAVQRVSSGYFAAAIQGQVAAVRQAIEAGVAAVKQYGELRATQVYAKPHDVSEGILDNGTLATLGGGGVPVEISGTSS